MQKHLVELKAHAADLSPLRERLRTAGAVHHGTDHQIDRYFPVAEGRLKLRLGNVERSLIFYHRPDTAGPKDSAVSLTRLEGEAAAADLGDTLHRALGTRVVVDKVREIYFIDNVKFHLDRVRGLGTFVEIEAIGSDAREHDALLTQLNHYRALLNIHDDDLLARSYSDMLLERQPS